MGGRRRMPSIIVALRIWPFWLGGGVSPGAGAAVAACGADGCPALLAAGSLALAGSAVPAGAATATPKAATVTTVTSGLDNPRGLAFLPNGTLAVAEAG